MSTVTKVKKITANEQVYHQINEAISSGIWPVGKRIPSEIELAEGYGVNRLTVRVAIQRFVSAGVLETRPGDGTYVREFSFRDYVQQMSDFYLNDDLSEQMFEFRSSIESECARLAIMHASEEDISELNDLCYRYEQLKETHIKDEAEVTLAQVVECDMAFHKKVVDSAHNKLFSYAYEMAQPMIERYMQRILEIRVPQWRKLKMSDVRRDDLHRVICIGIEQKNFEICRKAFDDMIDYRHELT